MKKIKKAICLLMSLLMIPIANLSVNAEQIYSGNLTEYLYNGEPFSWNGFGPSGTVTEITPSFTNSDSEVVAIPPSSYNANHSRAAKVSFTAAGTDVYTNGWNTPNLTPLVDNGYLRVELYFDGTAEQAKNMSFYLRDTSYRASREVSFNVFTPKEWSECLIPIADLIDNDFTGGNLREFRMKTSADFTGSCDVYIHEIGFKSLLSGYKITNPIYTDSKWGYYDTTGTYVNINGNYHMWSNSVSATVGSFSAERNAGQGSSVKYDMLALKNTYTGTNTANIQLPIEFSDSRSLNISSMSSYGYLSFDMYIDTNQTIGNGDMSVAVYDSSGGTGYKQFAIEPNKWQKITLKLSDMGITGSLSAVKGVRFMCGTTITEAYSIYVQHIGFAIPVSSELISVAKGATGVDLTWYEGILSGTSKYYINRNGVKIAEVSAPATSYTDTTAVDGIVNYTISDVDSSNNILATSPKKYYQEFNSEYSVVSSLYTNANNQQAALNWRYQFGTWNNTISADVGSFTTENAIIGGKSVKYDMQALNNTALDLPLFDNLNTYDIRDIVGTGYVRFAIYVDTDQELSSDAMRFRLETSTGMVHGYRSFSVEENEWQIIYVKLSDIIGDSEMTRAANVNGIKFQCTDAATGKLSFYIQEIDFVTWAGAAVKNVVLTNAAGNTVSNMTDVDTKIVANFDLREFKDVDCVIYVVLYEEDESEVLSFAQTTISLSAGSTESVEVENIIPAEAKTQDCVYKIFVWQENTNIAKSEPFSQLIEE